MNHFGCLHWAFDPYRLFLKVLQSNERRFRGNRKWLGNRLKSLSSERRLESLHLIALGKTFITRDAIKVEVFSPLFPKLEAMKLKEGKIKLKKKKLYTMFKLEFFFKGSCLS